MAKQQAGHTKPWLTPEEQVAHLKGKGVRFDLMGEAEAAAYLARNNNYFRIRSYRAGFPKVDAGPRKGEYANLDFAMLADLSTIDMHLRDQMLPLTLDIEHFAKVKLLGKVEEAGEDGYAVVADFLAGYDAAAPGGKASNRVWSEIERGTSSPYVAGILERYGRADLPVWALLELISFGTFSHFYGFCARRFGNKAMLDEFYLLQSVRCLRNACAHGNCILNDMGSGSPMFKASYAVSAAIGRIPSIGRGQRRSKLSNDRLQQIATTLFAHSRLASDGVRARRAEGLRALTLRMARHADYYEGNCQVSSGLDFVAKLVGAWYPEEKGLEESGANG